MSSGRNIMCKRTLTSRLVSLSTQLKKRRVCSIWSNTDGVSILRCFLFAIFMLCRLTWSHNCLWEKNRVSNGSITKQYNAQNSWIVEGFLFVCNLGGHYSSSLYSIYSMLYRLKVTLCTFRKMKLYLTNTFKQKTELSKVTRLISLNYSDGTSHFNG